MTQEKRTAGRPKGSPNKRTAAIRDMIVSALERAGGEDYLFEQAQKDPKTFLSLVAKVMPTQVTGEADAPLEIRVVDFSRVSAGCDPQTKTEHNPQAGPEHHTRAGTEHNRLTGASRTRKAHDDHAHTA